MKKKALSVSVVVWSALVCFLYYSGLLANSYIVKLLGSLLK